MRLRQAGFTLIELVLVIIILGVLAAVALPRLLDLGGDAKLATLQGVAGALSSASTVNFSARAANPTRGVPVANCRDVARAMQGYNDPTLAAPYTDGLPSGYTIDAAPVAAGAVKTDCAVNGPAPAGSAPFTAAGIN